MDTLLFYVENGETPEMSLLTRSRRHSSLTLCSVSRSMYCFVMPQSRPMRSRLLISTTFTFPARTACVPFYKPGRSRARPLPCSAVAPIMVYPACSAYRRSWAACASREQLSSWATRQYSDKYENIGSHRVDRIAEQPEILDEPAVPPKAGFSVEKYVKTTFRMYNAPRKEVELLCDNGVMDAIIDQFGPDVHTYAGDLQNFRVIEEVAVGKVFFNWIFGFEGKVRIKAPADVKEQYRQMVENAAKVL